MPGSQHSGIEGIFTSLLLVFVREKGLGRVLCGEALIKVRSNPDTLRAADVAFVSYKSLPKKKPLPVGLSKSHWNWSSRSARRLIASKRSARKPRSTSTQV